MNMLMRCVVVSLSSVPVLGNGWSFEPPPAETPSTNSVSSAIHSAPSGAPSVFYRGEGWMLVQSLNERLQITVRGRFDVLNRLENLSRESALEHVDELESRKGKAGIASALRLTLRQHVVQTFKIGGAIGKILGGSKIGQNRPSPFNLAEGIAVWDRSSFPVSGVFWDVEPFRESPYTTLGFAKVNNWSGAPLWDIQARVQADDWQVPRFELSGGFYTGRPLSFEGGVQLRAEPEGRGASFARGDDQRFAVFCGANVRLPYGRLGLRVSGPDTIRGSIAYDFWW